MTMNASRLLILCLQIMLLIIIQLNILISPLYQVIIMVFSFTCINCELQAQVLTAAYAHVLRKVENYLVILFGLIDN